MTGEYNELYTSPENADIEDGGLELSVSVIPRQCVFHALWRKWVFKF